jgi:hypothetical protein
LVLLRAQASPKRGEAQKEDELIRVRSLVLFVVAIVLVLSVITGFSTASGVAEVATSSSSEASASHTADRVTAPEHCSAKAGLRFYTLRLNYWRSKVGAVSRVTQESPGEASCPRYLAKVRRSKAHAARMAYERWSHEYEWQKWLPANWQALGACETGYGQRPGNWNHHNYRFVSAFGISRVEYDNDAAYFHAAPWSDSNPPTPRDQYAAARGHLARFGDGWGCPGP